MSGIRRPWVFLGLKIVITCGLIGWLAAQVDYAALGAAVARARGEGLLLALFLVAASLAMGWIRWWVLFGALRPGTPVMALLASYSIGMFANNFLPSGVGGDAARCAHMASRGHRWSPAITSSMVDRVTGIVGLLILACLGLFFVPPAHIDNTIRWIALGWLAITLVGIAALLAPPVERWIARREPTGRVGRLLKQVAEHGFAYRNTEGRVVVAVLLTLVGHFLQVLCYYDLGLAVGLDLPLGVYVSIVPAVMLATNIPISLGGLGLREGALVTFMVAAGADLQLSIAVSLLFLAAWLIVTLPGGIALARWGDRGTTLKSGPPVAEKPGGAPPS